MNEQPNDTQADSIPNQPVRLDEVLRAEEPPLNADDTSPSRIVPLEEQLRAEEPPVRADDTNPSFTAQQRLSDDWPPRDPQSGGSQHLLALVMLLGAVVLTSLAAYIWWQAEETTPAPRLNETPTQFVSNIGSDEMSPPIPPTQTPSVSPTPLPPPSDVDITPEPDRLRFPTAAADEIAAALLTPLPERTDTEVIARDIEPFTIRSSVHRTQIIQYTIQAGDTLESIAAKFDLESFYSLIWSNSRNKYSTLRPGTQLNIPPEDGVYYEVTENITIAALAQKYNVEPYTIIDTEYNNLFGSLPETLVVKGMWIGIPGGEGERINLLQANPQIASGDGGSGVVSGVYNLWGCSSNVGGGSPPYTRPVASYKWMQGFSLGGHEGVDLSGSVGNPVIAAGGGTVAYAGWNDTGYGYIVVVAHGPTFSLYGHLDSYSVNCGQGINAGVQIGTVGNTGNSTGPHLHFEIRDADWNAINPQNYIGF